MRRDQLIKHWDCIVAFKNGKQIQQWEDRTYTYWSNCNQEDIEFDINKNYRIKPRNYDYDYSCNFLAGFIGALILSAILLLIYFFTKDETMFFFIFIGGGCVFIILTALYPKKIYRKY